MNWGNWTFNSANLTLTNKTLVGYDYDIDLEKIHSSADILDWIYQVFGKDGCDQKTIHDLVSAFDEILDPQANFCSFGEEKKQTVDNWLKSSQVVTLKTNS
ncbi:hypothetical protein FJR38_16025 [Anabaena sp. UHCC 0253]|uniref:hypothetical protein n=1 Tax=Anabaena sp. UHCC 0253 TaxID=2590019 RepID=UPI001445318F|nr:hypothetical protein [Anabaena sp. UHCC 0253]MTJ54047.1 hypothetical protein [Anabaena sp. UHCC 0253]